MTTEELLEYNLKKCDELDISVIDIAKEATRSAFANNITFRILEARRTYERQCLLLSQGRTRSQIMSNSFPYGFKLTAQQMKDMMKIYDEGRNLHGPTVTWTLDSDHIKGLAMDIQPLNTTYAELALHFSKWGITHPYMKDQPHFNLSNAKSLEPNTTQTPLARLRSLGRALLRPLSPEIRALISNEYDRLRKRLGV